jgi:D-serine deaminase-like pyridoxal phosphate-dependent protein
MDPVCPWWRVSNIGDVPSPALLVYPDRVKENIRRMIQLASSPDRLWPHVKTHKMPELILMQMDQGIGHFKAATIAEAEMVASCGAPEVLLAYQPVGPNARRLLELVRRFPQTKFATVADDAKAIETLAQLFQEDSRSIDVMLDIDCGMNRTGIPPAENAVALYRMLSRRAGVHAAGLHVYDGHIHDSDVATRTRRMEAAFHPVWQLRAQLEQLGLSVPRVVTGGTPTFPLHARHTDVDCSPGTCVLWDAGYEHKFPDLGFSAAAAVLTRVVSKPGVNRLCLDLGNKAIAAENPHPRVEWFEVANANPMMHSEEHLVVETPVARDIAVGDCLYGVPWHICPTVALHGQAVVVRNGCATERWNVVARDRTLTV